MKNLKFENLDLGCDYGACLWINGKAVKPEMLPISAMLCQRINEFEKDYYLNALDCESNEWWQKHSLEELEIAHILQKELPQYRVRLFTYNSWQPINRFLYKIDIIEGVENGSNYIINAVKSNNGKGYGIYNIEQNGVSDISPITIDEDFFFYAYWFLEKYFDKSIQGRENTDCTDFEWWGDNYYTYSNTKNTLSDLKRIVFLLIKKDFKSSEVEEWKDKVLKHGFHYPFLHQFELYSKWNNLNDEEKIKFIEEYSFVYIDFYTRFIDKMEKMMIDNPECDLICFSGP